MCGNFLGSGPLFPGVSASGGFFIGLLGTGIAVSLAPSRWLARASAGSATEEALVDDGRRASALAVVVGLVLVPTVLLAFPLECLLAALAFWVFAPFAVPALAIAFCRPFGERGNLQRRDCTVHRAALAGALVSVLVGVSAAVHPAQRGFLAPSVLAFAASVGLALTTVRVNAARNALAKALVDAPGAVVVPLDFRHVPAVPNVAAGLATHVVLRAPPPGVEDGSYRVAALQVAPPEPWCLVNLTAASAEVRTSARALAAWGVAAVTVVAALWVG